MSSIRLYILDALAEEGAMHGHQLRLLAEKEHVDEWTDISVGALYGALKRMHAEGLIDEVRTEREGAYPERQVCAITEAGRVALGELRYDGAHPRSSCAPTRSTSRVSRLDLTKLDELPALLQNRLAQLKAAAGARRGSSSTRSRQYLTPPS